MTAAGKPRLGRRSLFPIIESGRLTYEVLNDGHRYRTLGMRLLKTEVPEAGAFELQLYEFIGEHIPPYAILSHTWGNDEVLFDDIQNGTAKGREGSAKVVQVCSQARKDGHSWVWVDTCCIDKTNSTELSEAINSMFDLRMYAYYQDAECCYAYLADVHHDAADAAAVAGPLAQQFRQSRWFTRGWCLQELLAPKSVEFFSAEWQPLGDKLKLQRDVALATHIDPDFLTGFQPVEMASVAKRMSWAALRVCTRGEDLAYCLMGLFGVNMPLLYGEGPTRAFLRLQKQIMESTDDHSIFAWTEPDPTKFPDGHGLLADTPKAFLRSAPYASLQDREDRQPFSMTNTGLSITLFLTTLSTDTVAAALKCPVPSERTGFLVIYLRHLTTAGSHYVRVDCSKLDKTYRRGHVEHLYVYQNVRPRVETPFRCVQLQENPAAKDGLYQLVDVFPPNNDSDDKYALPNPTSYAKEWVPNHFPTTFKVVEPPGLTAILMFRRVADGKYLVLLLGMASYEFKLAFQCRAVAGPTIESHGSPIGGLQALEALTSARDPCVSEDHRVQIDVQMFSTATRKTYYVDIFMESLAKPEVLEQVPVPVKEEVKHTAVPADSHAQKKLRRFFDMKKH